MYLLIEIYRGLSSSLCAWATEKPGIARAVLASGALLVLLLTGKIILGIVLPSDQPSFSYRKVYGSIKYSDGTNIPAALTLNFIPKNTEPNATSYPPSGMAITDRATGEFKEATSRVPGDGILSGHHSVHIGFAEPIDNPNELVPERYLRSNTSPLTADTSELPLIFIIERPTHAVLP